MLGRIKTQNLQRRIQVPLVILEKIRTLLLTLSILYPNFGRYIRSTREEAEVRKYRTKSKFRFFLFQDQRTDTFLQLFYKLT